MSAFSRLILELHTKEYHRLWMAYLEELLWAKDQGSVNSYAQPIGATFFSSFNDLSNYDGGVPPRHTFQMALSQWFSGCRDYFDAELKKRGGVEFNVDVSYKVCAPLPT